MKHVFAVEPDARSVQLARLHCTLEAQELQELLAKNFDLLAGEEIDPIRPRQWMLVKREMPVPDPTSGGNRWAVDFLFVDQDSIPTFVECKRFNDTRSRREVIGQVMEYAANGQFYWDHKSLKDYAQKTAASHGESLEEALAKLQQEEQRAADLFFQKVEANLKEGNIRIVFFMEESPLELRSIVEFLNKQLEHTEILIVEARQYTKDNMRLVVPSLFGYTEQARRAKAASSSEASEERRSWNRRNALEHIAKIPPKALLERVEDVLRFVDGHQDCLREAYGTGQTPTVVIRNLNGDSILYVYSSGIIQLPIPQIMKTQDFASVQSSVERHAGTLTWKGSIEPTRYPSLQKKIQSLDAEEQKALKEFLLELVASQHE